MPKCDALFLQIERIEFVSVAGSQGDAAVVNFWNLCLLHFDCLTAPIREGLRNLHERESHIQPIVPR